MSIPSFLRTTVLACLVGFVMAVPAQAQSSSYVTLDYLDADEGGGPALENILKNVWKPIRSEQIRRGTFAGWQLYRVEYPGGEGPEYDYVTAIFYNDWSDIDYNTTWETVRNAHPGTEKAEFQKLQVRTRDAREMVRKELLVLLESVGSETGMSVGDYITVDLLKVPEGGDANYVQTKTNFWKPVHQALMNRGEQKGWFLGARRFAGSEDPHNYIVLRPRGSWQQVALPPKTVRSVFSDVHPDRSVEQIYERTRSTRTVVRTEIWTLVDQVMAR